MYSLWLTGLLGALLAPAGQASTGLSVINNYKKEMNIKIQGSGVGGCDIIMQPGVYLPLLSTYLRSLLLLLHFDLKNVLHLQVTQTLRIAGACGEQSITRFAPTPRVWGRTPLPSQRGRVWVMGAAPWRPGRAWPAATSRVSATAMTPTTHALSMKLACATVGPIKWSCHAIGLPPNHPAALVSIGFIIN
jgi:hypothetical protein